MRQYRAASHEPASYVPAIEHYSRNHVRFQPLSEVPQTTALLANSLRARVGREWPTEQ